MKTLEAEAGETPYNLLSRAIKFCWNEHLEAVNVLHNDVIVTVYAYSFIKDLCAKYDLQRELNIYKEGLTR